MFKKLIKIIKPYKRIFAGLLLPLLILFVLLFASVSNAVLENKLKKTKFAKTSFTYYQNLPINDPLLLNFSIVDPLRLTGMIEIEPKIEVKIRRLSGKLLEITPKSTQWPRRTNFKVNIYKPYSPFLKFLGLQKRAQALKSLKFTTAGKFEIIQSARGLGNIDPKQTITLRFNYRLKEPENLKSNLTISPEVPLVVEQEKNLSEKEIDMVYKISSPEMKYSQNYELVVSANVLSELDEPLGEPETILVRTIKNPNVPSVEIASGNYRYELIVFPQGKQKKLPLTIIEADKVAVKLFKITAAQAINYFLYFQENERSRWSRKSIKKIDISNNTVVWQNELAKSDFNNPINLPELPVGVYALSFTAEGGGEVVNKYAIISITNLGAIASIGKYDAAFWVSSVKNGEPISGAEVRLYKLLDVVSQVHSSATNDQGLVSLDNESAVDLAVVFYQDDVAFVPLDMPQSTLSPAGEDRRWWWYVNYPSNEVKNKAYLYSDRPIYKPGDTVYAKAIIREDKDLQYQIPTETFRLTLKDSYWDDDKKPLWEKAVTANNFGTISEEIKLTNGLKNGQYFLNLEKDGAKLQTIGIYVGDYRKPFYQTTVETEKNNFLSGEQISFNVKSTYSFGMPVKDREVEWAVYTKSRWHTEDKDPYAAEEDYFYGSFWWDYSGDNTYLGKPLVNGTAKLNSNGEASISFTPDPGKVKDNFQTLTIEVLQKDEQFTLERATKEIDYYHNEYSLKIMNQNRSLTNPSITVMLTNVDGKIVSGQEISLNIKNGKSIKETTDSEGLATFRFQGDFKEQGNNQLVFKWKDSAGRKGQHKSSFYYGSPIRGRNDVLGLKEKQATIEFPDRVKRGEIVNLKVKDGGHKHLVIVGRGTVITSFVVDNNANNDFKITDEIMPNAYLHTYSFKDGELITSKKSITATDIENFKNVNLSINADKNEYLPGETVNLDISTVDSDNNPLSSEVSISVVDKAIFQLKNKADKPIHPYFYRKRFNDIVESDNLSGIKQYLGGGGGGGGGGGIDSQLRSNFEDTAYNKANIYTDSNGQATVSFKLPDNLTTWVLSSYAVTQETEVGEHESEFLVNKDIFAVPIFPQFLTNGDRSTFRALVANTTGSTKKLRASFALGGVPPTKDPTQHFSISGSQTKVIGWQQAIQTGDPLKQLSLLVTTQENEILDGVTTDIPVNQQGLTVQTGLSGIDSTKMTPKFLPGANKDKSKAWLFIHGSILGYVNDILSYQAGYPYGCIEQTMSKFYPTALVKSNLSYLSIQNSQVLANLDDMVKAGLERIEKYQHSDGGWGLWEYDKSKPYYTSYVLNGLIDLRGSFDIPERLLSGGKEYLEKKLESKGLNNEEKIMVLVSLSKLGSTKVKQIDIGNLSSLDDQKVAEAAVALATVQSSRTSEAIDELKKRSINVSGNQVKWNKGNNLGHFSHDNLTTALALQAFLMAEPDNDLIQKGLNFLNANKNRYIYGSTYTNAQVVKTFIGYLRNKGVNQSGFSFEVKQDGKTIYSGIIANPEDVVGPIELKPDEVTEIIGGQTGAMLWEIKTENVFSGKINAYESDTFSLKRSYKNLSLENQEIRAGDLFEVIIEIKNKKSDAIRHLIVEDMLPAGAEAVNPYFDNESAEKKYYGGYAIERYKDRVVIFPYRLRGNSTGVYRYLARAFLPGKFLVNPASVSLMYNPEKPAFTATTELTIKE